MKRRDFITKSTIGAATATTVLTGITATAAMESKSSTSNLENKNSISATSGVSGITDTMMSSSKARSGVVLGGIGAGGAEIRKDGVFYNWSIANNSPKGTGKFMLGVDTNIGKEWTDTQYPLQPDYMLFFILRYQLEGENPKMKILQIEDGYKVGGIDMHIYEFPWMTGVEKIEYSGCFPFVSLKYYDAEMPFDVTLNTWSAFIPNDVKNSSLPLLNFDFNIISKTSKKASVMISAIYRSMVGYDLEDKVWDSEIIKNQDYLAHVSKIKNVDTKLSSYGDMALGVINPNASYHTGWGHRHQFHEWVLTHNTLRNLDDTEKGRNYTDKTGKLKGRGECYNAIAVSKEMKQGDVLSANFVMSWNFPNLYDTDIKNIVGHYYSNFFTSSAQALAYGIGNQPSLKAKTKLFVDSFYETTAPQYLLDLVNSQLTTFITSGLLGKNMEFGVLEGITQHQNWGPVGTTDVNMYGGVMIASLFPELAKSTMKIHKQLQMPSGEIRHSFKKGFAEALIGVAGVTERLDLHSQFSVMALRDFFWTNDLEYLKEIWPSVKKALEYTLKERDMNGDQQPDMTGIMSSYDNFPMYGMASYIQSQWLAALASALQAAKTLNDSEFTKKFTPVFEKGKKLAEEKLWNGKYYRLYNSDLKTMKTKDGAGNEITKDMSGVDEGCLTDQLIGQWAANWSGLGDLFNKENRKKALKSVVGMSYKSDFGLKNCSWPGFEFYKPVPDDIWVDQGNTVWSGVEVSFVSFLLYEGLYTEALAVAKTVHERYLKCGRYWDHQEFGGHYFRAMGAWGIINGMIGMSINQGTFGFKPALPEKNFKVFFSFPGGFGHLISDAGKVSINVLSGELKISKLNLDNFAFAHKNMVAKLAGAELAKADVSANNKLMLDFKKTIIIREKESIEVI
ncbi:MAG: GH116 family glycosyl hydrolase [Bacteroidota bacterium]|nr:GH116 family glycosyl hydrolase [Bacteroidota bacterium]